MASKIVEQSIARYNIQNWGEGYFGINSHGSMTVSLRDSEMGLEHELELASLAKHAKAQGLELPLLLRFKSILRDRTAALTQAFYETLSDEQCEIARYMPVYPIKVNQQRSVVEELCKAGIQETSRHGPPSAGLECGSKAELIAILSIFCENVKRFPDAELTVICNGYKDRDYLRLALIGGQMGFRVFIVIEKLSEMEELINLVEETGITPMLGLRVRLSSIGKGKWQNSGGEKSKFGLTALNLLAALERLETAGLKQSLQLLHFHIGSQIANINDIQLGLTEASQYYAEVMKMGFNLRWLDVGGGLGVDYEGSRSRRYCSMNYNIDEYARNIVHTVKSVCLREEVPFPNIITEAGRAMSAHHAVLLTEVFDAESVPTNKPLEPKSDAPEALLALWRTYKQIQDADSLPLPELYHDLSGRLENLRGAYVHGLVGLKERAYGESIYHSGLSKILAKLAPSSRFRKEIIDEVRGATVDKLFMNFSVFRSLPDVWGIEQVFPVAPIENLDREITRRVVIQDVTCDSDGRIDQYVDGEDVETSLPVCAENMKSNALYGFFLVGAYQEILGDNHNLFGESDTVDVDVKQDGSVKFTHHEKGDSVSSVLESVHFSPAVLEKAFEGLISQLNDEPEKKRDIFQAIKNALEGSSYLRNASPRTN